MPDKFFIFGYLFTFSQYRNPMSRSALLLFILFLPGFFSLLAQESSQLVPDPDLVKNSEQLNREVWFTSLEDAMREPEKVYKLNISVSYFWLVVLFEGAKDGVRVFMCYGVRVKSDPKLETSNPKLPPRTS
jgi:hypothetical protein